MIFILFYIYRVVIEKIINIFQRTSNRKAWVNPPLNPSEHLIENDVIDIFDTLQLCT